MVLFFRMVKGVRCFRNQNLYTWKRVSNPITRMIRATEHLSNSCAVSLSCVLVGTEQFHFSYCLCYSWNAKLWWNFVLYIFLSFPVVGWGYNRILKCFIRTLTQCTVLFTTNINWSIETADNILQLQYITWHVPPSPFRIAVFFLLRLPLPQSDPPDHKVFLRPLTQTLDTARVTQYIIM